MKGTSVQFENSMKRTSFGEKVAWIFRRSSKWLMILFIVLVVVYIYHVLTRNPPVNIDMKQLGRGNVQLKNNNFYLNNTTVKILSGAVHYFRVVPEYWEDRLSKLKAAGLNTVETYVPWNLHEEVKNVPNYSGMLDLRVFLETAHELGLFVILRPGPYICSEWELGGLPSWLLRDPDMNLRSTYKPFMTAVDSYFKELFGRIAQLQYQYGGPIIAMQVENEFGAVGRDEEYMSALKAIMEKHGVVEPLFTSDNKHGLTNGYIHNVFMTINFKNEQHGLSMMKTLEDMQPGLPCMVMEYWSGWFDHWMEQHHHTDGKEFVSGLDFIITHSCSFNIYMFHGGTNFGFMNGANHPYTATITSYDYDAPLSEIGDVTNKFRGLRSLLTKHQLVTSNILIKSKLPFDAIIQLIKPQQSKDVLPMEMLDVNGGSGQGYGFTLYRRAVASSGQALKLQEAHDRAQIFADNKLLAVRQYNGDMSEPVELPQKGFKTLDILVENCGRINYGGLKVLNSQRKGLLKPVLIDGVAIHQWDIYSLQFKPAFIDKALESSLWEAVTTKTDVDHPALYQTDLVITGQPHDTFISMEGWTKGVVFVNSFNLGRYWQVGPQKTLYLPAPLLKPGVNKIVIFELHQHESTVTFEAKHNIG